MQDSGKALVPKPEAGAESYGTAANHEEKSVAVPLNTTTHGGDTTHDSATAPDSQFVCLKYGTFLLLGFLLCIALRNNAVQFLSHIPGLSTGCQDDHCYGTQGVYRVSFSLLLFYITHFVMASQYNCCVSPAGRLAFLTMSLKWKVPVFLLTLVVSFLLPNQMFIGYGWVSVVASAIFLVVQVLILIDFAYAWNESWYSKAEEDGLNSRWAVGLVCCSMTMLVASYVLIGFMYAWFPCDRAKAFTTVTLLLNTFATLLSVKVQHGSVAPSSMVFIYNSFLCFTALLAAPDGCKTIMNDSASDGWSLAVSVIFSAISVTYAAVSTAHSRGTFSLSGDATATDGEEEQLSPYTFFHGMMILASFYLAMLVSSWDVTGLSGPSKSFDSSLTSMWVKIACSWVTIALYFWSLVAPYVLPDRFQGH